MSKRAIILAGGKGTRLRPYTYSIPKPLVPIGEIPILEIIVKQLSQFGFNHITITINHAAEIIKAYFGTGSKWDVTIDYSFEEKQLSTMGPLTLIKNLPENFLIMNGDVLTDLDLNGFSSWHKEKNSLFTISSYSRNQKIDYGVLELDDSFRLEGFKEKPVTAYNVSMGVYMANKKILDFIPQKMAFGFDDLVLKLIKQKQPLHVKPHNGYWLDIGRPEDYEQACKDIKQLNFL